MSKLRDLSGQKFGDLEAIEFLGSRRTDSSQKLRTMWSCRCKCGQIKDVRADELISGRVKSCGCSKTFHGHASKQAGVSRTYRSWRDMKQRCDNQNHKKYSHYGGRGITYDSKWKEFVNFLKDMGESPVGATLDRIDNNGNYCVTNCRWVSYVLQNSNHSGNKLLSWQGKTMIQEDWCRFFLCQKRLGSS